MTSERRARRRFSAAVLFLAGLLAPPSATAGDESFVGARSCATCHAEEHARWASARHGKMIQPANGETVLGDFGVRRLRLRGEAYELEREGNAFFITESRFTTETRRHRVDYTLGSRRIQHYLTRLPDGRIIVLPPTWDVRRREWIHNMDIVAPEESSRQAVQVWNKNCFGCHVSDAKRNYDPRTDTYATRWEDYGTSCERCHGPGAAHVRRYTDPSAYEDEGPDIVVPTRLDPARITMVCAQCHSLRDELAEGFTAGADYFDYFLPLLEYSQPENGDPAWWPDGRTRRFSSNALGIWQSRCFLEGGVACTNCHVDTHDPEIEKNERLRPTNNALCTGCHAAIGERLAEHTHHAPDGPGSSCVECHMPRTVVSIRARMRDHALAVPVPENTRDYGIPNACNVCHEEKSPEWAIAALEQWFPGSEARQKWIRRARAFTGGRAGDPRALDALVAIAREPSEGPLPRANALGYLDRFDDPRVAATLLDALGDPHPLVRAVAASRLGQLAALPDRRRVIEALALRLEDPRRAVRMNAALALLNLGVYGLGGRWGEAFERAKEDHVRRAALHPDDAFVQLEIGKFYLLNHDAASARDALDAALALEPASDEARYFKAIALVALAQTDEARKLLRSIEGGSPFGEAARSLLERLGGRGGP